MPSFDLARRKQNQVSSPNEVVTNDNRGTLVHHGHLTHRRDGEIQISLFEECIFLTKKMATNRDSMEFQTYRPPIKLDLLKLDYAGIQPSSKNHVGTNSTDPGWKDTLMGLLSSVFMTETGEDDKSTGLWIEFTVLGRDSYRLVLQAQSALVLSEWVDVILRQQDDMSRRRAIFQTTTISSGAFLGDSEKINCAVQYGGGGQVLLGTDKGLYLLKRNSLDKEPVKFLELHLVKQVDVIESHGLLIVLADKQVLTIPLEALSHIGPSKAAVEQANCVTSKCSYFESGQLNGRMILSVVDSSFISSTVKMYEVIQKRPDALGGTPGNRAVENVNTSIKDFRHFYLPSVVTSIHHLKTQICVVTESQGFQAVRLDTLDIEPILDPQDNELDFVRKKAKAVKPTSIFYTENEIFLCYNEFAFFVDKSGRRAREGVLIEWEGRPTAFVLREPYVITFGSAFLEVRDIETGALKQIIQGSDLRLLFAKALTIVKEETNIQHQDEILIMSNNELTSLSLKST